jgi:hypothetical protein
MHQSYYEQEETDTTTSEGPVRINQTKMAKVLAETRKMRSKFKRSMSPKIATRTFRPPEAILVEKDYGRPVDIWGAGVCLAELFKMQGSNHVDSSEKREYCFQGKHSWPLEPEVKPVNYFSEKKELNEFPTIRQDKKRLDDSDFMWHIIRMLGTPDVLQTSFITSAHALKYLHHKYAQ